MSVSEVGCTECPKSSAQPARWGCLHGTANSLPVSLSQSRPKKYSDQGQAAGSGKRGGSNTQQGAMAFSRGCSSLTLLRGSHPISALSAPPRLFSSKLSPREQKRLPS